MENEIKCRWCATPINSPMAEENKQGETILYYACDDDCLKAQKQIDKLDTELKTYERLQIEDDYYGVPMFDNEDDEIELTEDEEPEHPYCVF